MSKLEEMIRITELVNNIHTQGCDVSIDEQFGELSLFFRHTLEYSLAIVSLEHNLPCRLVVDYPKNFDLTINGNGEQCPTSMYNMLPECRSLMINKCYELVSLIGDLRKVNKLILRGCGLITLKGMPEVTDELYIIDCFVLKDVSELREKGKNLKYIRFELEGLDSANFTSVDEFIDWMSVRR